MSSAAISAAAHHLVKRAVSGVPQAISIAGQPKNGDDSKEASPVVLAVLVATMLAGALAMGALHYTLGMVVPALAIVEDSQPAVYVPIDGEDDDGVPKNTPGSATDLEGTGPQGPITAKIRTTLKHLRARGGFWAPFRGLAVFIFYFFCRGILISIFSLGASYSHIFARALATIAADVALTALSVTWIHTVISEPSANARVFWKRIPAFRTWKKVVPAVALQSVASHIAFLVPLYLGIALHSFRMDDDSLTKLPQLGKPSAGTAAGSVGIFLLTLALTVLIDIPASVALVRVAASALSPDVDTIVPFDRTFNGKVGPAILGGGCLGLLEAWKGFTWPSRVRLMKLLAKYFAISVAVGAAFVVIFAAEIISFSTKTKLVDGKN